MYCLMGTASLLVACVSVVSCQKSFYEFSVPNIDGELVPLEKFKGKVSASQCY